MEKRCPKCSTVKPFSAFGKDRARLDGMSCWCRECNNQRSHEHFAANKDRRRELTAEWRRNNVERAKELGRAHHHRHKEKRNAASMEYRRQNPERIKQLGSEWFKKNPTAAREIMARRRAAKKNATPPWAADEFDRLVVTEAYDLAVRRTAVTGVKWQVDHIVPLQSDLVCGLHCAANLQVLTAKENRAKRNLHWPDMPV